MNTITSMIEIAAGNNKDQKQAWESLLARPNETIPKLIAMISAIDECDDSERSTLRALEPLLEDFEIKAVPFLIEALQSTQTRRALGVFCNVLCRIGRRENVDKTIMQSAVPALFKVATDRPGEYPDHPNWRAVDAIIRCGPTALCEVPDGIVGIASLLTRDWGEQGPDCDLIHTIAFLLGTIGSAAVPAVPNLVAVLSEKIEPRVGFAVVKALGQIGSADALIAVVKARDFFSLSEVVIGEAIRAMGLPRDEDVPLLIEMIKTGSGGQKRHSYAALERVGGDKVLPLREHCLATIPQGEEFAWRSSELLGQIGVADDETVAALLKMLQSRSDFDSSSAASTLGRLRPVYDGVASAIADQLKPDADTDKWIRRRAAATALGSLGPDAELTLDQLRAAVDEGHKFVAPEAAKAIFAISGEEVDVKIKVEPS